MDLYDGIRFFLTLSIKKENFLQNFDLISKKIKILLIFSYYSLNTLEFNEKRTLQIKFIRQEFGLIVQHTERMRKKRLNLMLNKIL